MRRVLIAWELGEDLGHVHQIQALAAELCALGIEPVIALRDVSSASITFAKSPLVVLQAPVWLKQMRDPPQPLFSYAEILFLFGYLEEASLAGMVRAWRDMIRSTGAELVIADHAPTAVLASRTLGVPVATIGHGFFVPPSAHPVPSFRPWMPVAEERLREADARVTATMNAVLARYGAPPLAGVSDLFGGAKNFLTCFAETDHYQRAGASYFGPIAGPSLGDRPNWPEGTGPKVFAYLKAYYKDVELVIESLVANGCRVLTYLQGVTRQNVMRLSSTRVSIVSKPLDIESTARECDLGVCHAGWGTAAEFLLAGKPQLLLPFQLEQLVLSQRLNALGVAHFIAIDQQVKNYGGAVRDLLADARHRRTAEAFASRNRPETRNAAARRIAGECLNLLADKRRQNAEAAAE